VPQEAIPQGKRSRVARLQPGFDSPRGRKKKHNITNGYLPRLPAPTLSPTYVDPTLTACTPGCLPCPCGPCPDCVPWLLCSLAVAIGVHPVKSRLSARLPKKSWPYSCLFLGGCTVPDLPEITENWGPYRGGPTIGVAAGMRPLEVRYPPAPAWPLTQT
jgi:hypothetical protein